MAAAAAAVTPATATHLDAGDVDTSTDTWANPVTVTALQTGVIDLTCLSAGLPLGAAGAISQYGQVTSAGSSAGASGLISNTGGVGAANNSLPAPAELDLTAVRPPGIAGAQLSVGAVAASSQLGWCSALESATRGDGSVSGVTRDDEIAGLDLVIDSPVVGALVCAVTDTGLSIDLTQGTITVDLEPLLTDVVSDVGLIGGVLDPLIRALTNTVTTLIGTLDTVLNSPAGGLGASLNGLFAALPGVLTLTVNVQPDQPDAPPHPPCEAATPPDSSAE